MPPIIAGFVTAVNINLPTWFAAGATLLAWLTFKGFFKEGTKNEENTSLVFRKAIKSIIIFYRY